MDDDANNTLDLSRWHKDFLFLNCFFGYVAVTVACVHFPEKATRKITAACDVGDASHPHMMMRE
jgi:hypothetical protein